MAGIGFVLRKLAAQDNLSGTVRAYFHSAIIAVAPWLLITISMTLIAIFTTTIVGFKEFSEFQAIFIYNFVFSLILSAPFYMVSARYVSDCLFLRDVHPIPGILISSIVYFLVAVFPMVAVFYLFYADLNPLMISLSIINFNLLGQIWIVMLYLGCIRNYRAITTSWILGLFCMVILTIALGLMYKSEGLLFGMNIGFVILVYTLITNILVDYPYFFRTAFEFLFYFRFYKSLFWSGFFLFGGMWIDKIIMWWAPESVIHLNLLRTYPTYDGAMMYAYITVMPVMALFIFSLETNFYDSYIQYVNHIERNAPLYLIEEEKKNIFSSIIENGRSFLVLQGVLTFIIIVFAPTLFEKMGSDFLGLGIFRLGTLGAFFSALNLFIVIIFSYFDSQDNMLKVTMTMFISNVLFTLLCLKLGFPYYGLGYCLSMILTFLVASVLFVRFLDNLTYHIFITNIVKRQDVIEGFGKRIERKEE